MAIKICVVEVGVIHAVPVGATVIVKSVRLNPKTNDGARGKSTDGNSGALGQASIGYIREDLNALSCIRERIVVNIVAKSITIASAFPYEGYANIRPLRKLENTFLNQICLKILPEVAEMRRRPR